MGQTVSQSYQRTTGLGTYAELVSGEEAAFYNVKKNVLSFYKINPGEVHDFQIDLRLQMASFTDPSINSKTSLDLPSIQNPNVQSALNQYYDITPHAREEMRYAKWVKGNCKGNQYGKIPLLRTTDALKKIPTGFQYQEQLPHILAAYPTPQHRLALSRRFLFVEYFINKSKEKIEEKINKCQKELEDIQLPPEQRSQLKTQLEKLQNLQNQLQTIDGYALSKVLMYYPLGKIQETELEQLTDHVKNIVLQEIKPKKWFGLKDAKHSSEDIEYAQDIAGMMFLKRDCYVKYCEKVFGQTKKETINDIFLREALQFALEPEKYKAEGFKNSILFDGVSNSLKEEVQKDLHDLGRLAKEAIKDIDQKEYEEETTFPDGATEEQKKISQIEKMQKALKLHQEKVNHELKIEDLPPEPAEEENTQAPSNPEEMSVPQQILRGVSNRITENPHLAIAAVGTGAARFFSPQVATFMYENPGPALVLSLAVKNILGYLMPQMQHPETGALSRKLHYRRTITAMAITSAALYFYMNHTPVQSSVNAVTQGINTIWEYSFYQLPLVMASMYAKKRLHFPQKLSWIQPSVEFTYQAYQKVVGTSIFGKTCMATVKGMGNIAAGTKDLISYARQRSPEFIPSLG